MERCLEAAGGIVRSDELNDLALSSYTPAMRKLLIGALVVGVLALASFFFFAAEPIDPNATECERDCINDSGGRIFCAKYCKENPTYGPQKK
jgi:hypothetical protein